MHLYEVLATNVAEWRQANYPSTEFQAIGEILEWSRKPDISSFQLREPQLRALETYWYLRLVEKTPHISDLYIRCFPRVTDRRSALGIEHNDLRDLIEDIGFSGLLVRIKT